MIIELYELGKMCLVYCGDNCTCGLNNPTKLIRIPKSNVRNIPIKKKKKKK